MGISDSWLCQVLCDLLHQACCRTACQVSASQLFVS